MVWGEADMNHVRIMSVIFSVPKVSRRESAAGLKKMRWAEYEICGTKTFEIDLILVQVFGGLERHKSCQFLLVCYFMPVYV